MFVQTTNTVYTVLSTKGMKVYIQGGTIFADPTPAYVAAAGRDGRPARIGCLRVGLALDIRWAGNRVTTSPVRAFTVARGQNSPPQ